MYSAPFATGYEESRAWAATVTSRESRTVRSRGAGFKDFLPNGDGNVVPLCPREHRRLHAQGRETFEANEGVDLAKLAREYGEMAPVEAGE